ncbi:SDR family NAD(P)-dependent oxidoreductase, partial [Nocardia salmonicida]
MTDQNSPLSVAPAPIPGHGLLTGRKAVITAAAGTGIGSSTARRLLQEGADVVVSDWHERRLTETAELLSKDFPER